jgi:hypothetical protein
VSDFSDTKRRHGEAVNSCTPPKATGPYFAASQSPPARKDSKMHDTAVTTELPKLNLPQELLTEVKRGSKSRTDYGVEGMKPSLFGRFMEKLLGSGKSGR